MTAITATIQVFLGLVGLGCIALIMDCAVRGWLARAEIKERMKR